MFLKSFNTLENIMDEMMLGFLFDRIAVKVLDITPSTTLKLLLRCRLMLDTRKGVLSILEQIKEREAQLKSLNHFALQKTEYKEEK